MDIVGKIKVTAKEDLFNCTTGGVCRYICLETDRGVPWEEAKRQKDTAFASGVQRAGFYVPKIAGNSKPIHVMLALPRPEDKTSYYSVRPNSGYSRYFYPM